jgi:hypothetical protein
VLTTATREGAVVLIDGARVSARWPRVVVYVRGGRKNLAYWERYRQRLARAYDHCTLDGKPVPVQVLRRDDGLPGRLVAYVVYGLPAALRQLIDHAPGCVACWHYVMDTRPPRFAAGAGEAKAKARPRQSAARATVENPGGFSDRTPPDYDPAARPSTWSEDRAGR